jgi:protein farnesyltransferase subunit beta
MGRSAYTALAVATLLNLRTEEVVKGTAEWLTSCQTFEGGMSGSPLSAEAHGGYAFCVLAALCILYPPTELGKHIDLDRLIVTPHNPCGFKLIACQRWVAMQQAPEGGFAGRTNKLVDACYSWWVGGCWALIEASENFTPTSQPIWTRGSCLPNHLPTPAVNFQN